ncbi:D-alanine--D-alanine ligase [Shewanella surugensis]|uniref:D-alanine--D-alanine ligase n=1 Tax=Shewanella surugensis TaxID=212020 RepID=A0ABT0LFD1_9GAMM|nr:D-alanine--D-alanine ligase [Shewanella surugensis]MCL1126406.1 D-alanine--D-alanine ligase [Shewanella surugensis]
MKPINLLLVCGGGGDEHAISLLSAHFFEHTLAQSPHYNVTRVELLPQGQYQTLEGDPCEITNQKQLRFHNKTAVWPIDYVIPCLHGYPGETGDLQSYLDLIQLAYFGSDAEASRNCFNKVTAKMWFSALDIPNTPSLFLSEFNQAAIDKAAHALHNWGSIFIKAASQGSSVGCYRVDDVSQLSENLAAAFHYSSYVIIEKTIQARELEVAVYEYQGNIIATLPGEIICATETFYSFDEKYDASSQAITEVIAKGLSTDITDKIRHYAIKVFNGMKLKHLSRIDFFLTLDNEILLNEVNTFPGTTPISMFPKMLQNHGPSFSDYLNDTILSQLGLKTEADTKR